MVKAAIDQIRSGYKNVTCLAANLNYRDGMIRRLQGVMITGNGSRAHTHAHAHTRTHAYTHTHAKILAPQVGSFVGLALVPVL